MTEYEIAVSRIVCQTCSSWVETEDGIYCDRKRWACPLAFQEQCQVFTEGY